MSKKRLRTEKFFSRELLPKSISEQGEAAIIKFEEEERGRGSTFKFRQGDEVVHKFNIAQEMVVKAIAYKKVIFQGAPKNRLDGIICHFWEEYETE